MPVCTFLQLTSSCKGLNILWTCTESARALVWRSRSRLAFSRSFIRYSPPACIGNCSSGKLKVAALSYHHFQVHLSLAAKLFHAFCKCLAIRPYGVTKRLIGIEDRAEFEWQHRAIAEALADHAPVLGKRLLHQRGFARVFAHNHSEITAGIGKHGSTVNAS